MLKTDLPGQEFCLMAVFWDNLLSSFVDVNA